MITKILITLSVIAIGLLFGICTTLVVYTEDIIPMPCDEHEVYVWENYPTKARCVSNVEHTQHQG